MIQHILISTTLALWCINHISCISKAKRTCNPRLPLLHRNLSTWPGHETTWNSVTKMASAGGSDEVNKSDLHTLVPIILVLLKNGVVFERYSTPSIGDKPLFFTEPWLSGRKVLDGLSSSLGFSWKSMLVWYIWLNGRGGYPFLGENTSR